MKLLFRAVCCAVIISCLLSLTGFGAACQDIGDNVLRLHILANSDSESDQELKLKVRDGITEYMSVLFSKADSKETAMLTAKEHTDEIAQKAEEILMQNGCSDRVSVSVLNMPFDTRCYDDFSLPAGYYDAVRIIIGEGKGHNWWCVLYPAVCVPAAEGNICDGLNDTEKDIVTDSDRYIIRFRVVELFTSLYSFFFH